MTHMHPNGDTTEPTKTYLDLQKLCAYMNRVCAAPAAEHCLADEEVWEIRDGDGHTVAIYGTEFRRAMGEYWKTAT